MIIRLSNSFWSTALVTAVAIATGGCGDGGDASDAMPGPTQSTPVGSFEPDPVTAVPPAVYSDGERKAAFDRLNQVRTLTGLGVLRQNSALDQAAQAHSEYQAAEGDTGHIEVPGLASYTGADSMSRANAAGYATGSVAEVVAAGDLTLGGANVVDLLLGLPYHRMGMLQYHPMDMGVGFFGMPNRLRYLTVLLGRGPGKSQGAPAQKFVIWPADNATGVPFSMWVEIPDPIPENNGQRAGYAASLQVNDQLRNIEVTGFDIRDPSGTIVPTKLLVAATDANLRGYSGGAAFAAALPRQPLAKNTQYTVNFVGSAVSSIDGSRTPIAKNWSFTTGDRAGY